MVAVVGTFWLVTHLPKHHLAWFCTVNSTNPLINIHQLFLVPSKLHRRTFRVPSCREATIAPPGPFFRLFPGHVTCKCAKRILAELVSVDILFWLCGFGDLCVLLLQGCHWLRNPTVERTLKLEMHTSNVTWWLVSQHRVNRTCPTTLYFEEHDWNKSSKSDTARTESVQISYNMHAPWSLKQIPPRISGEVAASVWTSQSSTMWTFSFLWKTKALQCHGLSYISYLYETFCGRLTKFQPHPVGHHGPTIRSRLRLRRHKHHHLHCGLGGHRPAVWCWNWCWDDPAGAIVKSLVWLNGKQWKTNSKPWAL